MLVTFCHHQKIAPALPGLTQAEIEALNGTLTRNQIIAHPCFAGEVPRPFPGVNTPKVLLMRCSSTNTGTSPVTAKLDGPKKELSPFLRKSFGPKPQWPEWRNI